MENGSQRRRVFFFAAALVFTTGTLVLWRTVLPRLAALPAAARLTWQTVISIVTFLALTYLTSELNAFLSADTRCCTRTRGTRSP